MIIDGITLDHDLYWEDEYQWQPLVTVAERCIDGGLVAQSRPQYFGRPITLGGDQNYGWQKKSTVNLLLASHSQLGRSFSVTINGVSFTVRWRTEDAPACEFNPVTRAYEPSADFWYYGTIKLITIS